MIKFHLTCEAAFWPTRATRFSAGFDLYVPFDTIVTLPAYNDPIPSLNHCRNQIIVDTLVQVAIPPNHVGLVTPRSGLAAKHGLTVTNSPGIIDSDYRGNIKVLLINHGDTYLKFVGGDRIAQLIVIPCITEHSSVHYLDETERGANGLGSTGR
jgi:dUTP pyrophosphatase